jgi:hypothetical protein
MCAVSVSRQQPAICAVPEMELLLECARARFSSSKVRRSDESIDWQKVIRMAMRHRVLPILYQQLGSGDGVPDSVREKLRDLYSSNAARNMARSAELMNLLRTFDSHGLSVMCFRGPVLAETLYGDIALRQFSDLDLLVRPNDVASVSKILAATGYDPHFRLNERQQQALIRFRTERGFIRSADRLAVDVHWRLLPMPFAFEDDDVLWSRSVRTAIQGVELPTLDDEDMVLFLCIHGAKHGWDQLALLCDLAEMTCARPKLKWEEILRRARKAGKQRMVVVGLLLINELFAVSVPDAVRTAGGDRVARELVDELKGRLWGNVGVQEGGGGRKWLIAGKLMERARDRLAFAADLMVVPTGIECESVTLPRVLSPLYYLLRVSRTGWKYTVGLVGRGFRKLFKLSGE